MKQPNSQPEPTMHYAFPVYHDLNKHYELHSHDFHELVFIQSGRFRSQVGMEEHIAVPGDVLLYVADTTHEEWAEGSEQAISLACAFYWDGFGPDEPVFRRDAHGQVQRFMSELSSLHIFDEIARSKERSTREAPIILRALIAELERLKPHGPHAMVDRVRAYVRSRMAEPISVEDVADYVGFSRAHFSKMYHAVTGRTPWNDIQLMRVEEARRLIASTSLPLHDIAPKVGIATEYHLSRLLRSLLGTGVRELRK